MGPLAAFIVAFLPSWMKVRVLRFFGHDVAKSAQIGFSYLNVRKLVLGNNTYIGFGNIVTHLDRMELKDGARLNRWNRITSNPSVSGNLVLGERSSISLRHYLDVCDEFQIGSDSIIAGHRSTFFTHSKGVQQVDYTAPIIIGEYCYVGSDVRVVPGARLGSHCFLGMGSVLVGDLSDDTYCLVAGNPARVKKRLSAASAYFRQGPMKHPHHQ